MTSKRTYYFTSEIQRMMFSLGDCIRPLEESANLIESIVLQYLIKMVYQLEEICRFRESKAIGLEELLFLFRKDRIKLIRIIHYLKFKDIKSQNTKDIDPDEDRFGEEKSKSKKKLKICHDFFSQIDPNGSLLTLLESEVEDELKKQRRIRLEKLTRQLTTQQYLAYCEARVTNFTPGHKMQKFDEWLFSKLDMEFTVNSCLKDVLCYLAYEAVAEIVECALLVKRESEVRKENPLTFYLSPSSVNYELSSNPISKAGSLSNADRSGVPTTSGTNQVKQIIQYAITTSEIREAMRRLSHSSTLFSNSVKSIPDPHCRQLWL